MKAFFLAWPIPQTVSAQSEGREILQTVSAESPFQHCHKLPASLVGLRSAALRQERARQTFLRNRSPARRLVRAAARSPDRHPVLRTHGPLAQQGRHARQGCAGPARRCRHARRRNARSARPRIPRPQGRVFRERTSRTRSSGTSRPSCSELGSDFAFIGRQRRLRIGDEWYRVDLLFFHRRLRCLVIIDLKLGKFTHADAGQMHLYLNYAREHWSQPGENPPVGLILCAREERRRRPLRAGRPAQQGDGRGIPYGSTQ